MDTEKLEDIESRLRLSIVAQPTETTCGPTCLHAIYRYFEKPMPLEQVIREVQPLETGGTLAVFLACHALRQGYSATIYTYNLQMFDPTWFENKSIDIGDCLQHQMDEKRDPKMRVATLAYLDYLRLGGQILFQELEPALIRKHLVKGVPILTGLSATYLYGCAREREDSQYDSIRGEPQGHFVILCGYERKKREVLVADPLQDNPLTGKHYYAVGIERVIGAILLGIVTYDANLLVLQPVKAK